MARKIRQHPRVRPRQLNAFIDLNGKPLGPYVVDNISLGGALLRTPEAVELEGDARFVILLAGPICPKGVRAFARLVAAEKAPPALRIEWPHLDEHSKGELIRLLEASGLGRKSASPPGAPPPLRPVQGGVAGSASPASGAPVPPPSLEAQPTVLRPASGATAAARLRAGEGGKATARATTSDPPAAAPGAGVMPEQLTEALIARVEALEAQLGEAHAKIGAQQAEIAKLWASLKSR